MNSNGRLFTVRSIAKKLGLVASLGLVLLLAPQQAHADVGFLDSSTGSTGSLTTNTFNIQITVPAGEVNRFLTVAVITSKLTTGSGAAATATAVLDAGGYNLALTQEDLTPDDPTTTT